MLKIVLYSYMNHNYYFVAECEEQYGIRMTYQNVVKLKYIKKLRKKLYSLKSEEGIEFVHGCGKRKSPLQKSIEELEEYLEKLKGYTQKIHICGNRNSFSNTDNDATFMRMKEDAIGNGQLSLIKPSNYEISKTRKYKTDIGLIDNMEYHEDGDYYICRNGKCLEVSKVIKRKSKTSYQSQKTIYTCEDCSDCQHKGQCIKGTTVKIKFKFM